MNNNEIFATAAHLHVLLRRTTGRVTDTEWMASNPPYALAMVAFARDHAEREGLADLQRLADKLAALIPLMSVPERKPLLAVAGERLAAARVERGAVSGWPETQPPLEHSESNGAGRGATSRRYVGGIR